MDPQTVDQNHAQLHQRGHQPQYDIINKIF